MADKRFDAEGFFSAVEVTQDNALKEIDVG